MHGAAARRRIHKLITITAAGAELRGVSFFSKTMLMICFGIDFHPLCAPPHPPGMVVDTLVDAFGIVCSVIGARVRVCVSEASQEEGPGASRATSIRNNNNNRAR